MVKAWKYFSIPLDWIDVDREWDSRAVEDGVRARTVGRAVSSSAAAVRPGEDGAAPPGGALTPLREESATSRQSGEDYSPAVRGGQVRFADDVVEHSSSSSDRRFPARGRTGRPEMRDSIQTPGAALARKNPRLLQRAPTLKLDDTHAVSLRRSRVFKKHHVMPKAHAAKTQKTHAVVYRHVDHSHCAIKDKKHCSHNLDHSVATGGGSRSSSRARSGSRSRSVKGRGGGVRREADEGSRSSSPADSSGGPGPGAGTSSPLSPSVSLGATTSGPLRDGTTRVLMRAPCPLFLQNLGFTADEITLLAGEWFDLLHTADEGYVDWAELRQLLGAARLFFNRKLFSQFHFERVIVAVLNLGPDLDLMVLAAEVGGRGAGGRCSTPLHPAGVVAVDLTL